MKKKVIIKITLISFGVLLLFTIFFIYKGGGALIYMLSGGWTTVHHNNAEAIDAAKRYGITSGLYNDIYYIVCPGYTDFEFGFIIKTDSENLQALIDKIVEKYNLNKNENGYYSAAPCLVRTIIWPDDLNDTDTDIYDIFDSERGVGITVWVDRENKIIYFDYYTV